MARRSPRDAMLDSAIALFRERGVAATSLRDVVAHSKAPRGSIYHHFPGGKEELARDATRRAGDLISSLITELVASADPVATVDLLVDHWSGVLLGSDYAAGCPIAAAALAPDDAAGARDAAGAAFGEWEELLAGALSSRGTPPQEAADRAALVVSAIEGALLVSRARRTDAPLRAVGRELASLLG
ncbi:MULTISPECIES: TetR/AcrR family transcriptional regulator [unclassified Nocardioides]|jgi:TetR/AcrR family transcriptional repressor of lmrAB and yxaGH operons|uniref:TetR/AcrR family transcriptional regulator n=1 Tax=unclassified Nocardioides TaxID=2615069 RepID=UPI0007031126|nr:MULTISPECIES: TetR family transcriptional regulator [unclassified Nocardioides]KRC57737.1 TetR family transcriptional regulator [Nocardioides sp. Root79]KRC74940.1 TetR family transcriptional regulator [Nocardioides sp. Root240]